MTKNIKQYIPVFLSSTSKDMTPYRKAALNTLDKLKVAVKGMEIFGARTEEPLKTCLDEVSKSQFFICVLGMRYGSMDDKTGKSIVHLEYEKAKEKSLEILIYLIDEEKASIHPKFVDRNEKAKKLEDLKELLKKRHTYDSFQSPKDLAIKIERDLLRQISEKGLVIENRRLKPAIEAEKAKELLRKFDLMPKRFAGSEVELIIKFEKPPRSVPKSFCRAVNLEFGQALARPIAIIHPQMEILDFTTKLYTEYDGCDFLYDAPEGKEFKIIAKLAFGQERDIVIQPKISPYQFVVTHQIYNPPPTLIKNIEIDDPPYMDYVTFTPVRALILVKIVSKSKLRVKQKQTD